MAISNSILNRKGVTKASLLSPEVIDLLNQGLINSVNLTEWLTVDHGLLVQHILPSVYQNACLEALNNLKNKTAMQSTIAIGSTLFKLVDEQKNADLFPYLATHQSDTARCWATYMVGLDNNLAIEEKLVKIKPFAADSHFGVREIAWMAVRASVDNNLDKAIPVLAQWAEQSDANIRRFASEVTRPRGVWCKHIEQLKIDPCIALPILEPLKSDTEKYVRDSVANWLNDASKTQPEFVKDICNRWSKESNTKETAYIVKKATRSI